jgi:hypothetical protein
MASTTSSSLLKFPGGIAHVLPASEDVAVDEQWQVQGHGLGHHPR